MHKVSYVLAEKFSQDSLVTYSCKQHPSGAWKDNLPFCNFGCANTFWNLRAFKPIATGSIRDENIYFEPNRTSLMSEKIQTKQSLRSSKVSSSHQIPNY